MKAITIDQVQRAAWHGTGVLRKRLRFRKDREQAKLPWDWWYRTARRKRGEKAGKGICFWRAENFPVLHGSAAHSAGQNLTWMSLAEHHGWSGLKKIWKPLCVCGWFFVAFLSLPDSDGFVYRTLWSNRLDKHNLLPWPKFDINACISLLPFLRRQYTTCWARAHRTNRPTRRRSARKTSSPRWMKITTVSWRRTSFWRVACRTRSCPRCSHPKRGVVHPGRRARVKQKHTQHSLTHLPARPSSLPYIRHHTIILFAHILAQQQQKKTIHTETQASNLWKRKSIHTEKKGQIETRGQSNAAIAKQEINREKRSKKKRRK